MHFSTNHNEVTWGTNLSIWRIPRPFFQQSHFNLQYDSYDFLILVQVFKKYSDFEGLLVAVLKIVREVSTVKVCSLLCLVEDMDQFSNSWSFNEDEGQCWCTVIDSTFLQDETPAALDHYDIYLNQSMASNGIAFVQTSKIFSPDTKREHVSNVKKDAPPLLSALP